MGGKTLMKALLLSNAQWWKTWANLMMKESGIYTCSISAPWFRIHCFFIASQRCHVHQAVLRITVLNIPSIQYFRVQTFHNTHQGTKTCFPAFVNFSTSFAILPLSIRLITTIQKSSSHIWRMAVGISCNVPFP